MLTVPQTISVAKVSCYLSSSDAAKGSLFGVKLDTALSKKLYIERKTLEWAYNNIPNDAGLPGAANYLYQLCGGYGMLAQKITGTPVTPGVVSYVQSPSAGGGGTSTGSIADLDLIVGADSGAPLVGATSWDLSLAPLSMNTTGYLVRLTIDKMPQSTRNWDGTYFIKSANSNVIYFYGFTPALGSLFHVEFYKAN